jgi:hypothetical protein
VADLRVERKRRSILPWLLALVLVAAAVWLALEVLGPGDDEGTGTVVVEQAS